MQTDLRARMALVAPAGGGAGDGHPDSNTRLAWLRTQLAVERTLMAWNRTSLSLIGFGFTIYQFLKKLQEIVEPSGLLRPQAPRNFGLAFVVAAKAVLCRRENRLHLGLLVCRPLRNRGLHQLEAPL